MNTATHCAECGKELGPNKYIISPTTGGICRNRAWCSDCYEPSLKTATKDRVKNYYTAVTPKKWDDGTEDDHET